MLSCDRTREITDIKYHPIELYSELAFAMAHCIGADENTDQEVTDSITKEEMDDVINYIRERLSR